MLDQILETGALEINTFLSVGFLLLIKLGKTERGLLVIPKMG